MQPLSLIHPIYLDVPMMVSFAAAIEGGVAFDTEVTRTDENQKGRNSSIKGSFGLSTLFESLFDAGLEAIGESSSESSRNQVKKEQRAHTEASIAILLYDSLSKQEGFLIRPKSVGDLDALNPGTLIELGGRLEKSAIDAIIDYIDVISIMSSLDTSTSKREANESKKVLTTIRDSLNKDRQRTPLSNVVLRCDAPQNFQQSLLSAPRT